MPHHIDKKLKCKDCHECQLCSESRCRQCRKGPHHGKPCELGPALTHGEYLEWKKRKDKDRSTVRIQD